MDNKDNLIFSDSNKLKIIKSKHRDKLIALRYWEVFKDVEQNWRDGSLHAKALTLRGGITGRTFKVNYYKARALFTNLLPGFKELASQITLSRISKGFFITFKDTIQYQDVRDVKRSDKKIVASLVDIIDEDYDPEKQGSLVQKVINYVIASNDTDPRVYDLQNYEFTQIDEATLNQYEERRMIVWDIRDNRYLEIHKVHE